MVASDCHDVLEPLSGTLPMMVTKLGKHSKEKRSSTEKEKREEPRKQKNNKEREK